MLYHNAQPWGDKWDLGAAWRGQNKHHPVAVKKGDKQKVGEHTTKECYLPVEHRTDSYTLFSLSSSGPQHSKSKDFLEKCWNYLFVSRPWISGYFEVQKQKNVLTVPIPPTISWKFCHEMENHKMNCFTHMRNIITQSWTLIQGLKIKVMKNNDRKAKAVKLKS